MTADFLSHLRSGESNALTASQLCLRLNLPDTESGKRIIRACARDAVESGHLLCSGNAGYWLPATREEAGRPVARLKAEARSLWERARAVEGLLEQRFGTANRQVRLWGMEP